MGHFEFVTDWYFDAPLPLVWDAILHTDRWPQWWRGVDSVTPVRVGRPDGIGFVYHYVMRGALPYRLHFDMEAVAIEPMRALEGVASGEVEGVGRWQFSAEGTGTHVRYFWYVRLTNRAMRLLSAMGRPLFAWNHDVVMRKGEVGLARYLQYQQGAITGQGTRPAPAVSLPE